MAPRISAARDRARVRGGQRARPPLIDRASPGDLMELASDVAGSPMQVAAILVFDARSTLTLPAVREAVAQRTRSVPRMRQVLVKAPLGFGPPYWVDDPDFDIGYHVREVACPQPGDERALLDLAADIVTTPLVHDRPLWSAVLITDLADRASALVVAFHHVLSDGIGGLAVLANLVDGVEGVRPDVGSAPPPSPGQLLVDAVRARVALARRIPGTIRGLSGALAELKPHEPRAPRSSLNQPTSRRRWLGVARADLSVVRDVAHSHGATVNDVVLTAVTGALGTLLRGRGELIDRLVVSIPVSARRATTGSRLGNQIGVLPVGLPTTGQPIERLLSIAGITRARKTAAPGASAALLAPAFRLLARLGVFRWYVRRQRRVTTFVTNLRGPDGRVSFLGTGVSDVIPVSLITGNVTVAFAVMSYAGRLVVTVVADAQHCQDASGLVAYLQRELHLLTAAVEPSVGVVERG